MQYRDLPAHARKRVAKLDDRWNKFEAFLEDVGEPPENGYLLTRVNSDAGYVGGNCLWYPKEKMVRKQGRWEAADRRSLLKAAKKAGLTVA